MSINQPYAYDKTKTEKLGKYYNSIDFHINESLTNYNISKKQQSLGKLTIGDHEYELSASELQLLVNTCELAIQSCYKKFKLGML